MKLPISIFWTFLFNVSFGQTFDYPKIDSKAEAISDFIPKNWTIFDSAFGDLNKDGLIDAGLVLQYQDSISLINFIGDTVLTKPRTLLILFKIPGDKKFILKEQSNTFILRHENSIMDDPYQGIKIKEGILSLDFHLFYSAGSWYTTSSTYKFRFDGQKFELIGAEVSTIHRATLDYEDYSFNFLTKKIKAIKGNDQNGSKKSTIRPLRLTELKTLESFKEPYTWEVEADILL